jgi:hypothetical protein
VIASPATIAARVTDNRIISADPAAAELIISL